MSWFIVGRLCLNVTVDKMISVSNISITMEEIAKTVRGRYAEKFEMTKCEILKGNVSAFTTTHIDLR